MSVLFNPGFGSSNANNVFFVFSIINSLSILILLYKYSARIHLASFVLLIILCIEFFCYNRCNLPDLSPNSLLPLYALTINFTLLLQSLISVVQIYSVYENSFELITIVLFLFIRIIHCVWMMESVEFSAIHLQLAQKSRIHINTRPTLSDPIQCSNVIAAK